MRNGNRDADVRQRQHPQPVFDHDVRRVEHRGESFQDVKRILEGMIKEYVTDALTGIDREFAGALLRRRAPLKYWMKYYVYLFLFRIGALGSHVRRLFIEPMPLIPAPV